MINLLNKIKPKIKTAAVLAAVFYIFVFSSCQVSAARVEMQKDVAVTDTFDLGPTSFSIDVFPGQSASRVLQVTNRKGHEQYFLVEVEDFEGSYDPNNVINLRGKETGRYSAKDWIKPELWDFTTQHGQRQFFNVQIDVPADADVGDHYAAVLVSAPPSASGSEDKEKTAPTVNVRSRVGTLFFINVIGQTREEGTLEVFETSRPWYEKSPVDFSLVFKNSGTIRLQPQGKIEITDQFGKNVGTLNVEPFNVLRDSSRQIKNQWDKKHLAGRYTAKLTLNRGYGSLVDERTITFWVIPWKLGLIILGAIILLVTLLILAKKYIKFEISIGKKKDDNEETAKNISPKLSNKEDIFETRNNQGIMKKNRINPKNKTKKPEGRDEIVDLRNKKNNRF